MAFLVLLTVTLASPLAFWLAAPRPAPIPVRARSRRVGRLPHRDWPL